MIIRSKSYSVDFIEYLLKEYESDLYCMGITDHLQDAIEIILEQNIDLVFLNLENNELEIGKFLLDVSNYSRNKPYFIGCSRRKEEAYVAFQYNLQDFLLINNNKLEVRKCIHKYLKTAQEETSKMICIKSNKDYQYLLVTDILFLKADNNTTDIHMRDGSKISAFKTLKTFEHGLPKSFYRIHKSYIINSAYLDRIHYGKKICELFKNSIKVPFSPTFLKNIENIQIHLQEFSHTF